MLTHFHLMAQTKEGVRFQDVMRDMKKFTSKEISSQLERDGESLSLYVFKKASEQEKGKRKYKVWQDEYHPKIIYADTVCRQKMQYMHDNPARKGLVEKSECWLYSSARNYILNDDSVLSIERLEMLCLHFGNAIPCSSIPRGIPWQAERAGLNPSRASTS